MELSSSQRKFLRGKAHGLKAIVQVGHKGFSGALAKNVDSALLDHELLKVKFVDFKLKEQKQEIASAIAAATNSCLVGLVGHTAIFFRQHPDPEKRSIVLPPSKGTSP
ncbi:MAG: YhbY family RNA-binding protein [Desulfatibacillaceae bacterium]|nr:YhbY family RNA-binding protein [Desulfatibacillaceae bacterium]